MMNIQKLVLSSLGNAEKWVLDTISKVVLRTSILYLHTCLSPCSEPHFLCSSLLNYLFSSTTRSAIRIGITEWLTGYIFSFCSPASRPLVYLHVTARMYISNQIFGQVFESRSPVTRCVCFEWGVVSPGFFVHGCVVMWCDVGRWFSPGFSHIYGNSLLIAAKKAEKGRLLLPNRTGDRRFIALYATQRGQREIGENHWNAQ